MRSSLEAQIILDSSGEKEIDSITSKSVGGDSTSTAPDAIFQTRIVLSQEAEMRRDPVGENEMAMTVLRCPSIGFLIGLASLEFHSWIVWFVDADTSVDPSGEKAAGGIAPSIKRAEEISNVASESRSVLL